MRRASVVVLLVGGCGRIGFGTVASDGGSDATPGDPVVGISGTRIRAERWVAPDGASAFASWYDTQLASRCILGADESGTPRCFPDEANIGYAFADAACSIPLAGVTAGCATPSVGYTATTHFEAYSLGGVHTGPIYSMGTSCMPSAITGTFVDVGARLPDAQLVAATFVPVPAGDGMAFLDFVFDDGARQRNGTFGAYMGSACELERTGATKHCVTQTNLGYTVQVGTYYDAGCTIPAMPDPGVAAFHVTDESQGCWTQREVLTGTAHPNTTQLFFKGAVGCISYTIAPSTVVELVDAAEGRPALTFASAAGTTRLRAAGYATSTGAVFVDEQFDSQLGEPCTIQPLDATTAVCAPIGNHEPFQLSLDASCAGAPQSVHAICNAPMIATYTGNACTDSLATITAWTPQVSTAAASQNIPGIGCVPFDLSNVQLFGTTSTPVDITPFEHLTRVRD